MSTQEINKELEKENLRLANSTEAGWYYLVWDEVNEVSIKVWVTEI